MGVALWDNLTPCYSSKKVCRRTLEIMLNDKNTGG